MNRHDYAHYGLIAVLALALVGAFLLLRRDITAEVATHTEVHSFGFMPQEVK